MALKPVIYRARVSLNDIDRDQYEALNLTLALHPSETLERMMVRLLAFCLNYQEFLSFTKGLSTPDEPDILARAMDDELLLWIDIGEPSAERTKKASRKARQVKIYSFNEKSDTWWSHESSKIRQTGADVFQFEWRDITALAAMVERTMDIALTITDFSAYVAMAGGERDIHWRRLD